MGNCTDYHSYFLSLTRTAGILSRFHTGFSIPKNHEGQIAGYHCWADYHDGESWIPVDIFKADKHPELRDYYFGQLDENRVAFTTGRDIKLENLSTGRTNYFIYPNLEIDGKPSNQYQKKISYKIN